MKVVQKIRWLILAVIGAMLVVGCEPITYQKQYDDAQKQACTVQQQIAKARQQSSCNAVQINNEFSAADVYHSGETPAWLNNPVNLRANELPLQLLMTKLLPQNAVGVQYSDGANNNQPITIDYNGNIRGALDKIAAQTGYAYDIEDSMITWSPFVTKTYDVSFMPGSSQYLVGQKQGDTMFNTSSSTTNTASGQTNDSQYSSMQGNLSVWDDLQNSIKEILSPDGKVMVSESTTTVTVRDHPQNVQEVGDYLASMNHDLSKEVLLQVHVFQVALNKSFNFGIDWNVAYNTAASAGFSTGDVSQPLSSSLFNLGSSTPSGPGVIGSALTGTANSLGIPGVSAGVVSGPFSNTQILINALSQQGTVSNVTNPEVVTLNNQVAQIDISTQTTYLASSTNTISQGVGGFSQTSLNPGVVDTGFKLYILPKIMNGNIYLEVSSELSTLDSLQTISPQGSNSEIELPTVSGKHFNLRSMVPNASTLIIGGFKTVDSTNNHLSEFGVFGGSGANNGNTETILIITPTVMGNNS